jgi:transcriptional regulatory protein LEU3
LYSLCVLTLKTASTLAQNTNFLAVCPSFIERTLTLTGFAILKIARSPLAPHLDLPAGEQAYLSAIHLSKSMSLQNNDLGTRTSAIMSNLWSSTKVFKRKDGHTEALALRLRTRLSMSVSFDMFWYWREEFGHMSNPYDGDTLPSNYRARSGTPCKFYPFHIDDNRSHQWCPVYVKQQADQAASASSAPVLEPSPIAPAQPAQPTTTSMKFNPTGVVPASQIQLPDPITTGLETWNGAFCDAPMMLDQFPDYDWAASFDFTNDWPNVGVNLEPVPTAGYNFG